MASSSNKDSKVTVRRWRKKDLKGIYECQRAAYPSFPADELCELRHFEFQFQAFPEGQFLAEKDGKIIGYATSLIVEIDNEDLRHRYWEITGGGTFGTHDPSGDTLYGSDIAVLPEFRGQGVAGLLYRRRKQLVRQLNLRRMVAYGLLPGYAEHSGKLSPGEYIEKVKAGKLKDSSLTAHLKAGYEVKGVLLDFVGDPRSLNNATLLEWLNPKHDRLKRKAASAPLRRVNRKMRICSAQFLLQKIKSFEEFEQICEFFADSASDYHCHFLVLPEYFTTQLLHLSSPLKTSREMMEEIADQFDKISELFVRLAMKYQVYVIAGSTPQKRGEHYYNVSLLVSPSGNVYSQDKLHVTPGERQGWGITPGEKIRVFDTPLGRIGIQICYDIEFPETTRLLALSGVEVVFVPFNTDEERSFLRVHYSAKARAIENYLYVVTSALVGNMPFWTNCLLNYGRSAIFTPSDVAFPAGAELGIADPNVESIVTSELDLETLALQRELGTVTPFFDRRTDLYKLESRTEVEIVRVT